MNIENRAYSQQDEDLECTLMYSSDDQTVQLGDYTDTSSVLGAKSGFDEDDTTSSINVITSE